MPQTMFTAGNAQSSAPNIVIPFSSISIWGRTGWNLYLYLDLCLYVLPKFPPVSRMTKMSSYFMWISICTEHMHNLHLAHSLLWDDQLLTTHRSRWLSIACRLKAVTMTSMHVPIMPCAWQCNYPHICKMLLQKASWWTFLKCKILNMLNWNVNQLCLTRRNEQVCVFHGK